MARQLGFQTLVLLAKILNSCQVTAIVIRAHKQLLLPVHTYMKSVQFHSPHSKCNMPFRNTLYKRQQLQLTSKIFDTLQNI